MRWLTWINTLNLLDVFNYYLILGFVVSTAFNIRRYRAMLGLMWGFPNRWPKLLALVKQHRTILLSWPTLLAIGFTFALMLSNSLAIHLVWVHAQVTFEGLWGHWLPFAAILVSGALMLFLDSRAIYRVGRFDRTGLEEKLDKAESWLKSWAGPALRMFTLGFVNPRKIVGLEVQKALVEANWLVIGGMWRWSLRIGMQLAVGLCLWLTWAFSYRGPS